MPEVRPNGFGDESKLKDARMLAASFSKGKSWKDDDHFNDGSDKKKDENRRQTRQLNRGRSAIYGEKPWRQLDVGSSRPLQPYEEPLVVPIHVPPRERYCLSQEEQMKYGLGYVPDDAIGIDTTKAEQVLFELEPILGNKQKSENLKPRIPSRHVSAFAALEEVNVPEAAIIEIDSDTLYPVSEDLITESEQQSRKILEPFEGQIPDWAMNKETIRQMNASDGLCQCSDMLKPAKNGLMSSRFADPQVHRLPSAGAFTLNLPVKIKVHEPECPLRRCRQSGYDEEPIVRRVEPHYAGHRW